MTRTKTHLFPHGMEAVHVAKNTKKRTPKTTLKLLDLEQSKSAVLNGLTSPSSSAATMMQSVILLTVLFGTTAGVQQNGGHPQRIALEQRRYAPSTINLRPGVSEGSLVKLGTVIFSALISQRASGG
jgi:hypothetical protein